MTSNEDLGNRLQKLNENGQQLQHQAEMLTRRLPVARTALETIAKGDIGPDVLQIAREALGTLNTLDVTEAIALFAGTLETQIPPVTVVELKRFRDLIGNLAEELGLPADGDQAKGSIATHGLQNLVEKACGPGSNARVLSRRNGVSSKCSFGRAISPRYSLAWTYLKLCCNCSRRFHSNIGILIPKHSLNVCGWKGMAVRTNHL